MDDNAAAQVVYLDSVEILLLVNGRT